MTSDFGPLLRQARGVAGMTQEQLAHSAGVSVRTIGRLETGRERNFRLDTVRRLADALDLSADARRGLMSAAGVVPPGPPEALPPLAREADDLARGLVGRWEREVEQRGAHSPFSLPVRWRPVPSDLADHWANVLRLPPGATAEPLDLTGDLTEIEGVYRRVPSGRLFVLGRAGAGKTVLMLQFVLGYLARRTSGDPVPVVFSLGGWDPTAASLRTWLVDRLLRDHPDLVAGAPGGGTLAAALVDANRVLPVLDGFDEIPAGLRGAALRALNATSMPVLVTSRPDEYRAAVGRIDVLTWAAGIWIDDLTTTDIADYLRRAKVRTPWDPVLADLRAHPDTPGCRNLAAVLSTPLMVVLARTVYSDGDKDPAALLDTARFPTPRTLEDHLLADFVPTAYGTPAPPPHWTPERVRRWLGYLARHLDRLGTPDLAWWQLGSSLPRPTRILGVIMVVAAVTAVIDCLAFAPRYMAMLGQAAGLRAALADSVMIGPMVGLGFGLVYAVMVAYGPVVLEPSHVQVRLFGRTGRAPVGRVVTGRFGAGVLGGFLVGLGYESVAPLAHGSWRSLPAPVVDRLIETVLVNSLVSGAVFGLAAGLSLAILSALEVPADLDSAVSPPATLRAARTTVLRSLLVLAPTFALTVAFGGPLVAVHLRGPLTPRPWPLSYSLIAGAVAALVGLVCFPLATTAWGQWLLFTRLWLPLTGRLPWALTEFLDDAYRRQVLRQSGAVYQFRHARLQDHLSRSAP